MLGHARAVGCTRPPPDGLRAATVDAVKGLLAGAPTRVWTLAELGAAVHYSPYFLARMFHRHTGYPIARVPPAAVPAAVVAPGAAAGADLSRIAAEHGFSSHSHYTGVPAAFGCTPSQARESRSGADHVDRVAARGRDEQVDPAVAVDVAEPDRVVAERSFGTELGRSQKIRPVRPE